MFARPWVRRLGVGVAVFAVALVILVGAFPFAALKGRIEARLSERVGRPVIIGSIAREEAFSFTPTLVIRDVRAGGLAQLSDIRVRVRAWPLLIGRFRPDRIAVSGGQFDLVRDAKGNVNWRGPGDTGGGGAPSLGGLTVNDVVVRYRDALQSRTFTVRVAADTARGIRIDGDGIVLGAPVKVSARGAAIEGAGGKRWPFTARIDGAALQVAIDGTMAGPLDTKDMAFKVRARADDLKKIDAVIEAGLIGTQPVRLAADVRREGATWEVTDLNGTIGRSDLRGRMTVRKEDGRTKLDGAINFGTLDFEDLATTASNRAAVALEQREGLRLVPPTRINIRRIDTTDGVIAVTVNRIVSRRRPSSLTSARAVLTLDRQHLVASEVAIGLTKGAITGTVTVDQRGGVPVPLVTLALTLRGSSIAGIAGGGDSDVDARVDGRVRLTGRGSTIREAVGRATGSIGIVASNGALPAKLAAMLGFDVGRSLFTDEETRATLRCAVVRLDVRNGIGGIAPLVVDTSRSQTRGTGTVSFPSESLSITLTGAPKGGSVLRLPGSIAMAGSIREPQVTIPREVKSVGNILKGIGRAITGRQGPEAPDADCAGLSARVLG